MEHTQKAHRDKPSTRGIMVYAKIHYTASDTPNKLISEKKNSEPLGRFKSTYSNRIHEVYAL